MNSFFLCEGTSYVFFPVTAWLLTNVIIPVNIRSSAQLFSSILLQEWKVKVSHLFFHGIDYFVMLSIIYLCFDVINDSFFVNLLSYAQLFSSILLQETVKNESDINLFLDVIIFILCYSSLMCPIALDNSSICFNGISDFSVKSSFHSYSVSWQ